MILPLILIFITCSTVTAQTPGNSGIPGTDGTPLPKGFERAPLGATTEVVASGFGIPWAVKVLGEDEYLLSERFGQPVHVRDGGMTELEGLLEAPIFPAPPPYLGGYDDVSLHPQFAINGLVYLAYVNTDYQMAVGWFDFFDWKVRDFEVVVQSNAFSIGSRTAWQDDDHFFVTQSMAGFPFPDQGADDLTNHSGKIHRLLADGPVPPDNPVFRWHPSAASQRV